MSFVDGTMSREEFDHGALEFANDGLAQRRIAMDASSARYVELEADETQAVVEYLDDDDDDPQVRRRQIRGLSVRFHITYNASFRVPVLAVNVRRLPDTQLTPEQVLACSIRTARATEFPTPSSLRTSTRASSTTGTGRAFTLARRRRS